ncbi:RHS repeat-associated core domain-containing protein [Lachnospiraceae bacterium MD308]|nr:RHS repeat-associated core domain-containing protein [Lachnospiraceae bacterium MD308]
MAEYASKISGESVTESAEDKEAEADRAASEEVKSDSFNYYLYNKDIQGSTTSVLNEDGAGELSYEYDNFGETKINGGSAFQNEICYTGGIYDETTGLYYLNARYYDLENGRFLTEDTYRGELNEPDTLHLYVYCKNNPINYVDPSGHWKLAFAGAGYGYIVGSGATAVGVGTVIVVGGSIIIITGIILASTYYRHNRAVKVRLKQRKTKAKTSTFKTGKKVQKGIKEAVNSDPYARAGQKKQGRENKEKRR